MKNSFRFFIFVSYHWKSFVSGEDVPKEAVESGSGSDIYIGRVIYENELHLVTYFKDKKKAYITRDEQQLEVYEFSILMNYLPQYKPIWSRFGFLGLPKNAIEVGFNKEHEPCYLARVFHESHVLPAAYFPAQEKCYYVDGSHLRGEQQFDILVSRIDGYDWIGATKDNVPENYVVVGQDEEDNEMTVGLTQYEDERCAAKMTPAKKQASIPYKEKEISVDGVIYVLVQHIKRKPLKWVHIKNSPEFVNEDAVLCGYTFDGFTLHVGRALVEGRYYPGKLRRNAQRIYIPLDGNEKQVNENYEVLTFPSIQ